MLLSALAYRETLSLGEVSTNSIPSDLWVLKISIKNTKNQFEQVSHWEKASLDYWDNGLLKHLSIGQMYQHPSSLIL